MIESTMNTQATSKNEVSQTYTLYLPVLGCDARRHRAYICPTTGCDSDGRYENDSEPGGKNELGAYSLPLRYPFPFNARADSPRFILQASDVD
jgi:hypothetical protein